MIRICVVICGIILSTLTYCLAQGGIYSICDPTGKYLNAVNAEKELLSLEEITAGSIKDITITEFRGGWKNKNEARKQLIKKLRDKRIQASSAPLWNMDTPVELVGTIRYSNGAEGKIVVAQHRVGFQDRKGKPWYFQWEERMPWK